MEERVEALEKAVQSIVEKLQKLDGMCVSFEETKGRVEARMAVDTEDEVRLVKVEKQLEEVASKLEIVNLKVDEFNREWPAMPAENSSSEGEGGGQAAAVKEGRSGADNGDGGEFEEVRKKRRTNRRSRATTVPSKTTFAEKLRKTQKKILIQGDSLARGVGHKLKEHCGEMIEVSAVSGAKLGEVASSVESLARDESRELIVIAGANSLREESGEDMMTSFGKIVECGKKNSGAVVVVGFVKRYDLPWLYESKRIAMNVNLKRMCREKQVSFVEYEPDRCMVHRDGLHLNFRGQIELGGKLFPHLKSFLL